MKRMIRNLSLKKCLLIMAGMVLIACSNDDEDGSADQSMLDQYTNSINNKKDMSGEYSGQWALNGKNVDAEPANSFFLLSEYGKYSFNFTTFPFQAVAKQVFSQSQALPSLSDKSFSDNKITYSITLGKPLENEELLLYKTLVVDMSQFDSAQEAYATHINAATELYCVGYSMNLVYFELSPYGNLFFLRYPYVLTLSNGEYYAIVLDVVPSKSTVTLDASTRTMNFVCNIPQIEVYDSDCNKTIIEQKPELILTFTSTNKTKAENGD